MRADGALARMSDKTVFNRPGNVVLTYCSAVEIALSQELVDSRMQVSMIEEKPASLPPIVRLTRVAEEVTDDSWLLITSVVLAPEQAANMKDEGELAAAHSAG